MKSLSIAFIVFCLAICVAARPRYIAIPVDDIQFLSFAPPSSPERSLRVSRQASYRPSESPYVQGVDSDAASSEGRHARQSGHHGDPHDYVDYGAHTGHHGAFGWYADFPVHAHDH